MYFVFFISQTYKKLEFGKCYFEEYWIKLIGVYYKSGSKKYVEKMAIFSYKLNIVN